MASIKARGASFAGRTAAGGAESVKDPPTNSALAASVAPGLNRQMP
jgi:hypothetical protein